MAFRAATSRRAGAGILGTLAVLLAVLLAAALATGQPGPVLALRRSETLRPPPAWPRGKRISCSTRKPPRVPPRLKAGTPSQFPAGRSRAACPPSSAMAPRDFRKPPNPGRLTAAISSAAAPAGPRNSFSRRPSRRMRATTSPAGLAAPRPAPRNSPFSSRAQAGEFSLPPRSDRPGNRRSPCSISGRRPARFRRARRGPG